jgi:pilus assembly protein CpaE
MLMFASSPKKTFRVIAVTNDAGIVSAMAALAEIPGFAIETRSGPVSGEKLVNAAAESDLLLLDVDLRSDRILDVLASIKFRVPTIVLADQPTLEDMRRLMRMGITDIVERAPTKLDLLRTIETVMQADAQMLRSNAGRSGDNLSIAFIGATGSAGSTTLAVHVAAALAKSGQEVGLLDFDLQFGSVAHALDIDAEYSMLDIISAPDRLDGALLRGLMHHHRSGLRVLCAGASMPPLHALSPESAIRLVETARAEFPCLILDMPKVWLDWSHAILSLMDTIVLTTRMSVSSLRHCRRQLDIIAAELPGAKPVVLVANHHKPRLIGKDEREKIASQLLGREFDIWVPSDPEAMAEAGDAGETLFETRGGAKIRRQVGRLVTLLTQKKVPAAAPASRSPILVRQEA